MVKTVFGRQLQIYQEKRELCGFYRNSVKKLKFDEGIVDQEVEYYAFSKCSGEKSRSYVDPLFYRCQCRSGMRGSHVTSGILSFLSRN